MAGQKLEWVGGPEIDSIYLQDYLLTYASYM